jgi:CubicO group peptidase (beta-lactamase class C family)
MRVVILFLAVWAFGCSDPFKQRLVRMDAAIDPFVTEGKVPGIVALVLRDGKPVYERAVGWADLENKKPMRMDTIFRVASHTKTLTSVAALMLIEEGKLSPDTRVGKYLPSFYYTRVAEPIPGAPPIPDKPGKHQTRLVPMHRHITIHHLLTHTSGITYGGHPDISDQYKQAGFGGAMGHAWNVAGRYDTICEAAMKIGGLPLLAQPGTRWIYGYSTDVLGCIIEKVSGMKLDEFFRTRIINKLGMKDTAFDVPADKIDRFAVQYDRVNKTELKRSEFQGKYTAGPPRNFSGGAGLVSTVHDYARFLEMIRRDGTYEGEQFLKPASIHLMSTNQVGERYEIGGAGFGYGFEIAGPLTADYPQPEGAYGWYGILGTFYRVYPKERLVILLYTQLFPRDAELRARFLTEIEAALKQTD